MDLRGWMDGRSPWAVAALAAVVALWAGYPRTLLLYSVVAGLLGGMVWLAVGLVDGVRGGHTPGVEDGVRAVFLWALLFWGPRLGYLTYRFLTDAPRDPGDSSPNATKPLPCQMNVLEDLAGQIVAAGDASEVLIGLRGSWGSGKSTVIRMLQRHLNTRPADRNASENRFTVVHFNAWRSESEPSLELAIFREITRSWTVLRCTWHLRPFYRILAFDLMRSLKLSLNMGGVGAEVKLDAPAVLWHEHLDRTVRSLRRRSVGLVLVLDDVDRASPATAQVFMTLTRRFLSVPGLTTIVPFVPEQIAFKVFHPSNAVLPELKQTMLAVLWGRMVRGKRGPSGTLQEALENEYLAEKEEGTRAQIDAKFQEKFFGDNPVDMRVPGKEDISKVVATWPSIQAALSRFNLDETARSELAGSAEGFWERFEDESSPDGFDGFIGSLRVLEGTLVEQLQNAGRAPGANGLDAARFAVYVALRVTWLGSF